MMAITYSSIYRYRNLIVIVDKEGNESKLNCQPLISPSKKLSGRRSRHVTTSYRNRGQQHQNAIWLHGGVHGQAGNCNNTGNDHTQRSRGSYLCPYQFLSGRDDSFQNVPVLRLDRPEPCLQYSTLIVDLSTHRILDGLLGPQD